MALYIGGKYLKEDHRKRITGKVINKPKGNSFFLTVDKADEHCTRAAINREIKGVIKYQGWDEGTWARYRFYFYTPFSKSDVLKIFNKVLSKDFRLAEM